MGRRRYVESGEDSGLILTARHTWAAGKIPRGHKWDKLPGFGECRVTGLS